MTILKEPPQFPGCIIIIEIEKRIKMGFCGNLNLELLFFRDVKKEVGSEFLDKKRDLKTLFILFRLNGWKPASNCS